MQRSMNVSEFDLLGFPFDGLPRLFEDETLYSWCARFHRLAGMAETKRTADLLFGDVRARIRHDFPINLAHFDSVTHRQVGNISDLLNRTQLAFHRPFLGEDAEAFVTSAMLADKAGLIQKQLGLSKSGWRVPAPLKACPACMAQDEACHSLSYWHIEHQWPSVRICREHEELLLIACDDIHDRRARGWWLPRDLSANSWIHPQNPTPDAKALLLKLAIWTVDLLFFDSIRFSEELLRHCYLLRAKEYGWIAMDGSLRFQQLGDAFLEEFHALAEQPGMEFIREAQSEKKGFLKLLLRDYGGQRHPFKHILMMQFLYRSAEEFVQHYQEVQKLWAAEGKAGIEDLLMHKHQLIKDMVGVQGQSLNAVAGTIGETTTAVMRFARKNCIEYIKRPRVLIGEKESELKKLLLDGLDHKEIYAQLNIRTKYIQAYLAEHPDLRDVHRTAHADRTRIQKRAHFLEVLDQNPGVPIKRIRRISGNGFEWLYRNDLEWLRQHLPKIWSR